MMPSASIRLLFFFIFIASLLVLSTAHSESTSVTVEGVAVIQEGNLPAAREAAVVDALRQAVRQVVGTMVESSTLVENSQLVTDKIQTKTGGYVTTSRLVGERQESGLYRVTVEAGIDRNLLGRDLEALGLLYRRAGKPRIMILVTDSLGGAPLGELVAETEVSRLFIQQGFKVVDQVLVGNIRQSDQAKQALRGDVKAAQALGQQLGAEVLIVGDAAGEPAMRGGPLGGMVSVRARVQARAIRADTGEVLASAGTSAPGVDLTDAMAARKAITTAADRWVEAVLPVLIAKWTRETGGDNAVVLVVSGLSAPQVDRFKDVLVAKVAGITGIQPRGFAANVATFEISGAGTGPSLAEALAGGSFKPFMVEVGSVTAHRIEVRVQSE